MMVITKHSGHHNDQPGIKEITYVAMIPSPQPKPASRRICELPSLRYGSVGAKTIITGPLKITRYYNDTIPKMSSKKNKAFTIADDDMNLGNITRPKRHVRFSLPPSEYATNVGEVSASNGGGIYLSNSAGQTSARVLTLTNNGYLRNNTTGHLTDDNSNTGINSNSRETRLHSTATSSTPSVFSNSPSSVNSVTSAAALVFVNGSTTSAPLSSTVVPVQTSRRHHVQQPVYSTVQHYNEDQQQKYYNSSGSALISRQIYKEKSNYQVGGGQYDQQSSLFGSNSATGKSSGEFDIGSAKERSTSSRVVRKEAGASTTGGVIVNRASILASDPRHSVPVLVTSSPGPRTHIHPTGKYIRGTLSPTVGASAPTMAAALTSGGLLLLRAARDGEDGLLRDVLRRAGLVGIAEADLNASDNTGRTVFSYIASNGTIDILEQILLLPGLDVNRPDNEGNTPLHFAAQAGQVECLNCMLTRCRGIDVDARNNLGFTALMKAALQGRNKCAKLLLFGGANPTLRDNGRGLRADQWARFCGRYVCADVIEKHARHRLLERSTSYHHWGGGENGIDTGARLIMGSKIMPILLPKENLNVSSNNGIKSKLRKVFRTSSGPNHNTDNISSARLVTQLTTAALCASSPVLPTAPSGVPAVVKSLIRPLTVPKLQITLAGGTESGKDSGVRSDLIDSSVIEQCKSHESFSNNNDGIIVKNGRQRKKK